MPPEDAQPLANGGYISTDGINWEPIYGVTEFSATFLPEQEEVTKWAEVLLDLQKPQSYTITFPWWQDYRALYEQLFGIPYRSRYTVPMLRRNGKSHKKGKAWKIR